MFNLTGTSGTPRTFLFVVLAVGIEPVDTLLAGLNRDYAISLLVQCYRIAQGDIAKCNGCRANTVASLRGIAQ
ncbi:hypothetical protein [Argonema antarcticum]|uniref:hypothetical protein n=1 Tax=Argonema antarcticum TaxID=2942763 RepID=UPI002011F3F9|nr:hypothetical protein [Argonema antarcticum]MCL1472562.1 hypothetical protein [Argonema antarcticum A004/B2]